MSDGFLISFIREKRGSVGLEMAIALPIMLCLLMAAVDLSRVAIAQSLFRAAAIAEISIFRSYPASDIQDVTAVQIQSALLNRLAANAQMWIAPETVEVWFEEGDDPMGHRVYFTHHIPSYFPFRQILLWRQSYEKPFALYLQKEP